MTFVGPFSLGVFYDSIKAFQKKTLLLPELLNAFAFARECGYLNKNIGIKTKLKNTWFVWILEQNVSQKTNRCFSYYEDRTRLF